MYQFATTRSKALTLVLVIALALQAAGCATTTSTSRGDKDTVRNSSDNSSGSSMGSTLLSILLSPILVPAALVAAAVTTSNNASFTGRSITSPLKAVDAQRKIFEGLRGKNAATTVSMSDNLIHIAIEIPGRESGIGSFSTKWQRRLQIHIELTPLQNLVGCKIEVNGVHLERPGEQWDWRNANSFDAVRGEFERIAGEINSITQNTSRK